MICLGLSDWDVKSLEVASTSWCLVLQPTAEQRCWSSEELLCFDVQVNATCPGNINMNPSTQYLKAETCTVGI